MSCGGFHQSERSGFNLYGATEQADHENFRIGREFHAQQIDIPAGPVLEKPRDVATHDEASDACSDAMIAPALRRPVIVRIEIDDERKFRLVRLKSRETQVDENA